MSKKFQIAVSLGVATSLFVTSLTTVNAGKFTDVSESEMYMKGIEFLADQGIVNGNPDGSYKPANTLNRAEMVKIIAEGTIKLNDGDTSVFEAYVGADCFSDVPSDAWFTKYVCYAKEQGWVKGYEGNKFKPTQEVNFAESLKITFKGFGLEYAEDSDPWFKDLVVKASDGKYIPQTINGFSKGLKRGEMADMVSRIIKKDEGAESLDEYLGEWKLADVTYETIENGINVSESGIYETIGGNYGLNYGEESEDSEETIDVDASGFSSDANYKGPFPAPEGMVLKGKYGEDKFQPPTGPGPYRYQLQTAFQKDIVCLDSTRTLTESKGGKYDEGFYAGHNMADIEADRLVPVYDETPRGASAGDSLYDEAYRAAYNFRWGGGALSEVRRDCPRANLTAKEIADFDKDGWYKNDGFEKIPSLKEVYLPPMLQIGASSTSALGDDSLSIDITSHDTELKDSSFNLKKDLMNFTRIDIVELKPAAGEEDLDLEVDLQNLYNTSTNPPLQAMSLLGGVPTIETKTYGNNTVTTMTYVVAAGGHSFIGAFAERRDPVTKNITRIYFYSMIAAENKAKDNVDPAKYPNADFINEFMEKLVFKNQ